jgi:predicted transcriptional regulator YdeE
MSLTEEPEIVTWPETHYLFIERIGAFSQTAQPCWQELHRALPAIAEKNRVTGHLSLYKMRPDTYRAGVSLAAPPAEIPEGLQYTKFPGGKYSRFVWTGSYSKLPEVSGRVWHLVEEKQIPQRDDFTIEHYPNDPKTTPEEQLITEILIPTA